MTQVRFELDDHTIRVLDVIKGQFGLKNRSEALDRFAVENGSEYVDKKPNEFFLRELDAKYDRHTKKYGKRKMTSEEFDEIFD